MSESKEFSDDFVSQLMAGNRHSFTELVDRTSGRIYNLGLRMLGNSQDAEDMLQETYIKAFKALPRFENRSTITTWLFRIAVNEALMILRKRKNVVQIDETAEEEEDGERELEIVDWCCLPENEFLSAETIVMLTEAAEKLSPALRMVFILRDVQGFSTQETAEILQISEDSVKTRLVRARLKLREELGGYFRERMQGFKSNE
jgi:RNA polymerase sigma-70 factor (ECF subfamily)